MSSHQTWRRAQELLPKADDSSMPLGRSRITAYKTKQLSQNCVLQNIMQAIVSEQGRQSLQFYHHSKWFSEAHPMRVLFEPALCVNSWQMLCVQNGSDIFRVRPPSWWSSREKMIWSCTPVIRKLSIWFPVFDGFFYFWSLENPKTREITFL